MLRPAPHFMVDSLKIVLSAFSCPAKGGSPRLRITAAASSVTWIFAGESGKALPRARTLALLCLTLDFFRCHRAVGFWSFCFLVTVVAPVMPREESHLGRRWSGGFVYAQCSAKLLRVEVSEELDFGRTMSAIRRLPCTTSSTRSSAFLGKQVCGI